MQRWYYLPLLSIFMGSMVSFGQGLDASPAGVMISHGHPKGGWMVNYTYMRMEMEGVQSGIEKVNDDYVYQWNYLMSPQRMTMDMHMLMLMWGAGSRLSFMAMAEYDKKRMEMLSFSAGHSHNGMPSSDLHHTHESSGLGDTKIWGLYKLLSGEGSSLVLSLGVNVPTGSIDREAGEHAIVDGQRDTYMMQLGSGSVDFIPGLSWLKKSNKLTWSLQTQVTINSAENKNGYRYGNQVSFNGWTAYQFAAFVSASLRANYIVTGVISGADPTIYTFSEPAANVFNYGGMQSNVYGGINFYINKGILQNSKVGIEAGIPVYQYLNGIQQPVSHSINAGITTSF